MKVLLFILIIVSTFVSCTEQTSSIPDYWDSGTMFIVTSTSRVKGMEKHVIYEVEVVDPNGFSSDPNSSSENLKFEFTDSLGKYQVGQAIHFSKYQ
jgi:hypothetical protein